MANNKLVPDIYKKEVLAALLKNLQVYLTKERGQNFLLDKYILKKMANFIPNASQLVEIGPGFGHFTRFLLEKAKKYSAIEIDKGFIDFLKDTLPESVNIIEKDFLKFKLKDFFEEKVTVAGNIPYHITTKILLRLLRNSIKIDTFYLLMQKEVGDKIFASVGEKKYSRMTVLMNTYTTPKKLLDIPPQSFFPKPSVDSVFMQFSVKDVPYEREYEDFVTTLFSGRRKTIVNSLKKYDKCLIINSLKEVHGNEKIRVEKLSPDEIYQLYQYICK